MRRVAPPALGLISAALLVGPLGSMARAQAPDTRVGQASDALPGFDRVGMPRAAPWAMGVAASGGYAYTESVLSADDTHNRLAGRLAFSYQPVDFLAFALRLDGRYDRHTVGGTTDDGLVGDPRLRVRAFDELGSVSLGAQATLWAPGGDAPSLIAGAMSVDLEGMLGLQLGEHVELALDAGLRLDQSAASIDAPDRLSPSDRVALGLSGSNAFLMGVGGSYRAGQVQVYGEWTWDLLLGNRAAGAGESPMRLGAGVRMWLADADALQLEAGLEALLSSRPRLGAGQELAPVDPRFGAHVGLVFRFPAPRSAPPEEQGAAPPAGGPGTHAQQPTTGALRGRVTDSAGQPVAGAEVAVETADGARVGPVTTAADGGYEMAELPPGVVTVHVTADGYREQSTQATVTAGAPVGADLQLERDLPSGQIRGVVQSFSGQPVPAHVRVEPIGEDVDVDADGTFQIDVPPGDYEVVVTAEGYAEQRRPISVEQEGVTIINVDLRRRR